MELNNDGIGFNWFFLAMAHWQAGNQADARVWYDKALEWMEKNRPEDVELRRFHAEAEQLLGSAKKE